MNLNSTVNPAQPLGDIPQFWIGFDWGDKTHAFAFADQSNQVLDGTLASSPELMHKWFKELETQHGGHQGFIGIETSHGPAINVMVQYPWLTIYPINPATSSRYRTAFTPSGAKDDIPDAHVLLDIVRLHSEKLRPLQMADPQTRKLQGLVETRRKIVQKRVDVTNELASVLKFYYPQALDLVSDLDSDMAIDFLRKWPDIISLKAAKASIIKHFFYDHNLRRPELLEERLKSIKEARALTTDEAIVSVAVLHVDQLVDELEVLRMHIKRMDEQIKTTFKTHPQASLFQSLPGAGAQLAPRLCAAFGTDLGVFPDASSLQKLAGIAPVRKKSGKSEMVQWRWNAPVFLRQTFVEWAGQTVLYSTWAHNYYEQMKKRGKTHAVIMRSLAFKWIRILWKCWQTQTPYDENRYLDQLARRKSPYAQASEKK